VKASLKQNLLNPGAQWVRGWFTQIADPYFVAKGIGGYFRYFLDWYRYVHLDHAECVSLRDTYPQVHDRNNVHEIDPHYFFANGWALRRILAVMPRRHVDVASQIIFPNLLAGLMPVVFVDYRPLNVKLMGLQCIGGSLLGLPFGDKSVASLSCLHVIEHIGLGRYGDPLDPQGTKKAALELSRILKPDGNLYLAVPVGQPRLCFNAHRIHTSEQIREMFSELTLVEFSGVHDDGQYVEHVGLGEFSESKYACGFFWFRREKVASAFLPSD
jgi:SAM-dependent methyltransferase